MTRPFAPEEFHAGIGHERETLIASLVTGNAGAGPLVGAHPEAQVNIAVIVANLDGVLSIFDEGDQVAVRGAFAGQNRGCEQDGDNGNERAHLVRIPATAEGCNASIH